MSLMQMGRAKEHMMEIEAKGVSDHIETHVCSKHFDDRGVISFIEEQDPVPYKCNYCDNDEDLFDDEVEPAEVVPLPALAEFIVECISTQYDHPANWLGYNSREGGYQWKVFDTQELFFEIGLDIDNEELQDDILNSIPNDEWCERDPYGDKESDILFYTWRSFSEIIKHRTRYVFFKNTFKTEDDWMEPFEILDHIGQVVHSMKNLYNTFETSPLFPTFDFYRARQHKLKNETKWAAGLGSPPKEKAIVNRMSPAGISMFYCSDDENTAISEVLDEEDHRKKYVTVGCFQNTRPLNIINLNHLKNVSLFESDKGELYQAVQFLWRFRAEISKAVLRDGTEHYEYVPTQVVTEYFRDVFSAKYNIKIDGIQYPSVKKNRKSCFVLFFDPNDIINSHPPRKTKIEKSFGMKGSSKASLVLLNKSVKTFRWFDETKKASLF